MATRRGKFRHLEEGEAIEHQKEDAGVHVRLRCCDCGLVHDFVIENTRRTIRLQITRNRRATANSRRSNHYRGQLALLGYEELGRKVK